VQLRILKKRPLVDWDRSAAVQRAKFACEWVHVFSPDRVAFEYGLLLIVEEDSNKIVAELRLVDHRAGSKCDGITVDRPINCSAQKRHLCNTNVAV
jgi:hypothetical protein